MFFKIIIYWLKNRSDQTKDINFEPGQAGPLAIGIGITAHLYIILTILDLFKGVKTCAEMTEKRWTHKLYHPLHQRNRFYTEEAEELIQGLSGDVEDILVLRSK